MMRGRIVLFLFLGIAVALITTVGCSKESLQNALGHLKNSGLSEAEISDGLRVALDTAARDASALGSKVDGFLLNSAIKLLLPKELTPALTLVEESKRIPLAGELLSSQLDAALNTFVTKMNRAAESAAGKAFPVFKKAVTEMTITDALGILQGGDTAATHYLRVKTTEGLTDAFSPTCKQMMDQVEATKYYKQVADLYNQIVPKVKLLGSTRSVISDLPDRLPPDVDRYVTERTIHGMYVLMRDEEAKIRKDPLQYASDIIRKVFGSSEAKEKK